MGSVFDQMKADEDRVELKTHTSEEKTISIIRPGKEEEIIVQHSVQDKVEEQGYTKTTRVVVLECGCCGALVSYEADTRYKPPAGRCQNPACRALLCAKHEERFWCCVCGVPVCPACMRRTQGESSLVFCKAHFEELASEANRKEVVKCLTKD